jgi:hypothetical protein
VKARESSASSPQGTCLLALTTVLGVPLLASSIGAQEPVIYPANGQSPE